MPKMEWCKRYKYKETVPKLYNVKALSQKYFYLGWKQTENEGILTAYQVSPVARRTCNFNSLSGKPRAP